ncbi:MFS transporter [Actinopolyspora mortivallis]|uniref:MFS transporter n=1 Tax=Actinopolyspora mortivallis TaxID=33906 RepID=A0A2T0GS85_ACTMO|nr:MFS transporter [Actinopolyspora mortivallis]PRW61982.1 MFS transporter [Actinopolyspora mortivallis]
METETSTAERGGSLERSRWAPVVAVGLAMLAMAIDTTIVSVVLPVIGEEMGVGPTATKWVILGTSLPVAALTIPAGRWADRANARSVLLFSGLGVTVSGVFSVLAPNFGVLVLTRVLTGIFGGLMLSVYLPTVAANVLSTERGRAMGYTSMIMPLGTMMGSSLGGFLAKEYGWRPVLLVPIPLLLLVLWLAYGTMTRTPDRHHGVPKPERSFWHEMILLGGAITALMLASDQLEKRMLLAAVLALAAVALTVGWVRLPTSRAVTSLIRKPSFGLPLVAIPLVGSTTSIPNFLLPYFVSDVLHRSPAMVGIALLFSVAATAISSPLGGYLADIYGTKKLVLISAPVVLAGMASMLTLSSDAGIIDLAWRLTVFGAGSGVFGVAANTAVLAATPQGMSGTAGGLSSFGRTFAAAIGPTVSALAWTTSGGGALGFQTGIIAFMVITLPGFAAMLVVRGGRTTQSEAEASTPLGHEQPQ